MKEHAEATGLNDAEAKARIQAEGYNELPRERRRTPLRIVLEVLKEPMLAMLLVGALIYLAIGDVSDALILLVFAALSIVITAVQESRTERVLEALRDLSSPRALVIRGGERKRIPGREVARGDLVVLAEGDRVPADVRLLEAHGLRADESLLTGESVPVRKSVAAKASSPLPGGEDSGFTFSGTLIVAGAGLGEVTATGAASAIGKIGVSLRAVQQTPPRLQTQTRRLVRFFGVFAFIVSAAVVLLTVFTQGSWTEALLAGIALGMSMLPEEFPVVLAVFMAMGAWRISKERVLTRRAAAIETLGSVTVLCTDKTGTLTQNRMTIAELRTPNGKTCKPGTAAAASVFRKIAEAGAMASAPVPVDPMDRAFRELSARWAAPLPEATLERVFSIKPGLLAVTQVWRKKRGGFDVAAKGAPEAILELCRADPAMSARVHAAVDEMASRGLRVLGLARAKASGSSLPATPRDFAFEFLGLAGLADPLRESVPAAIAECRSAGVRVVMITGDYPATASAIAREAGLGEGRVITGRELAAMDDAALDAAFSSANVFARILPDQKLRLVERLKARNEVVAMTGDGVNDAPSIKAAAAGIAMGGRGTDVAREAASLVLLDDDFGSIVKAMRLGRRIYDNLRKVMGFITAVHVPIAGMALLPLLSGMPIVFTPVHIAFLEMVIDPVCSLVFEAEEEEDDVMRRPPRHPDEPVFTRPLVLWSVLQGALAFGLVAAIYITAYVNGMPETELRALTFFALVMSILGLVFVNRTLGPSITAALARRNPALRFVLAIVTFILALSLLLPWARDLFRFGPLHADDLALTLAAVAAVCLILEAGKRLWRTV